MEYLVEKETSLFSFLEERGISRKKSKQYLKNKEIFVNGKMVTTYDFLLKKKDRVRLVVRMDKDILILYEDRYLLVVDKPYHMLTIADSNTKENTLYFKLSSYVKQKNKKNKIYVVHRLDFDTAGLLVFSKTMEVKEILQKNWQSTKREYQALVHGKVKNADTLKFHLKENRVGIVYATEKDSYTKEAITEYTCLGFKRDISFVNIEIKTGRKHQIRVSFKEIGHPILGDTKYGVKDSYKHLYLHASKLVFTHPITNKMLVFEKSVPEEFRKYI